MTLIVQQTYFKPVHVSQQALQSIPASFIKPKDLFDSRRVGAVLDTSQCRQTVNDALTNHSAEEDAEQMPCFAMLLWLLLLLFKDYSLFIMNLFLIPYQRPVTFVWESLEMCFFSPKMLHFLGKCRKQINKNNLTLIFKVPLW